MTQKIIRKNDAHQGESLDEMVSQEDKLNEPVLVNEGGIVKGDAVKASKMAKQILEQALEEAKEIKEKAREILSRVQDLAKAKKEEGYKKGYDEGLLQFNQKIVAFDKANREQTARLEKEIVALVYEIGEKIIGRQMTEQSDSIVDLIKTALHTAGGHNVIILVHPNDLDVVKKNSSILMAALDASKTLSIRASEKVAEHGCLIETEIGTIDAQLKTQLDAIKKALGLEEAENHE